MNIFANIVQYDTTIRVPWVHNIKVNPPLPLGSYVKMSRYSLDNDAPLTPEYLDRVRRETFRDWRHRKDCGFFVHITAGPTILVPADNDSVIKRQNLSLHLVPRDLFQQIKQQNEYEWWELTNNEKELLERYEL